MYDSILVPVDGSDPSQYAAETAVDLAETFDAALTLLHVVEASWLRPGLSIPEDPGLDDVDELTGQHVERVESRAAERGVDCDVVVERGVPHELVRDLASTGGADLVAMGTQGRTGLERFLLGSTTERVLQTCRTPVLTTRSTAAVGGLDAVLVATDGSDPAGRAADHALPLAEAHDATVHALSVVDTRSIASAYEAGGGIPTLLDQLTAAREGDVEAVADRAADRGVDCETAVREGTPEQVVLEYTDEVGVDLVAMGTHGEAGIDPLFLGSVTERTVRQSDVPVLATPAAEE